MSGKHRCCFYVFKKDPRTCIIAIQDTIVEANAQPFHRVPVLFPVSIGGSLPLLIYHPMQFHEENAEEKKLMIMMKGKNFEASAQLLHRVPVSLPEMGFRQQF